MSLFLILAFLSAQVFSAEVKTCSINGQSINKVVVPSATSAKSIETIIA